MCENNGVLLTGASHRRNLYQEESQVISSLKRAGIAATFVALSATAAQAQINNTGQGLAALDPNWTFSDIMQQLLEEYRQSPPQTQSSAVKTGNE